MPGCDHVVPSYILEQLLSQNREWASENGQLFPQGSQSPPVRAVKLAVCNLDSFPRRFSGSDAQTLVFLSPSLQRATLARSLPPGRLPSMYAPSFYMNLC